MAIRVKWIIQPQLSEDTDGTKKLFYRDTTPSTVIIDTFSKSVNSVLSVATSSTDSLSLGDLTAAKGLYLEVNADCLVYLNGSSIPIQLRKSDGVAKLFIEADINQIDVENQSSSAILEGVYCLWGD